MKAAARRSKTAGSASNFISCVDCRANGVDDLDGIVDMAEQIAVISKEVRGRYLEVTASVSNFVPKPAHAVSMERNADA